MKRIIDGILRVKKLSELAVIPESFFTLNIPSIILFIYPPLIKF